MAQGATLIARDMLRGTNSMGQGATLCNQLMYQNKWNTIMDATAYILYQGWFGVLTLHVVVAYPLPSIGLAHVPPFGSLFIACCRIIIIMMIINMLMPVN
jgi:hypothetical protein